jgi:hypothetical protein
MLSICVRLRRQLLRQKKMKTSRPILCALEKYGVKASRMLDESPTCLDLGSASMSDVGSTRGSRLPSVRDCIVLNHHLEGQGAIRLQDAEEERGSATSIGLEKARTAPIADRATEFRLLRHARYP